MESKYFEKGTSLLDVKNLAREFKSGLYFGISFKAVNDVSFTILEDRPKVLTIAGESGCGKTTLANMLLGFLKPTAGLIMYKNKNLFKLSRKEKKRFRREVQPIFQDPFETFNPFNKVDYYLMNSALNFNVVKSQREAFEVVDDVLRSIGINPETIREKFPHEFSGGELQRLSIGRALISRPSLLIADEPVSMVDASLRIEILNLLVDLNKKFNLSIIYITHDLSTAYYLGEQTSGEIAIMFRGTIIEQGSIEKVLTKPLHPYTKTLIESIPPPDPRKKWTISVKPSILELEEFKMEGCKFAKRCQYSKDICFKQMPLLKHIGDELVRCWLYN